MTALPYHPIRQPGYPVTRDPGRSAQPNPADRRTGGTISFPSFPS